MKDTHVARNTSPHDWNSGFIRGLCISPINERIITVGDDKTIKIERLDQLFSQMTLEHEEPFTIVHSTPFTSVDHHRSADMFATAGDVVNIWSQTRSEPIHTFKWGEDTITSVKFNPVEVGNG